MQTKLIINGMDYSHNVVSPLKWNSLLDERLDEGRISLRNTSVNLVDVGSYVELQKNECVVDFIVSADTSSEIPVGSGKYNHEISIIEPTKMLEGIIVETLTFSNNLGRLYDTVEPLPAPAVGSTNYPKPIEPILKKQYYTPQRISTLNVYSVAEMFDFKNLLTFMPGYGVSVYVKGIDFDEGFTDSQTNAARRSFTVDITKPGYYTINYSFYWRENSGGADLKSDYRFGIVVIPENYDPLPKWNIASVIDRVLNLCEPHLQSVSPRFKLDPTQRAQFESIQSPEFFFTKKTLKEILDQIGGFIHGIPRLIKGESGEFDTIHYDMLGGNEYAIITEDTPYISHIESQNIEDYATELDSTVDNLVNTIDPAEGSIVDPYAYGYRTVRTEEMYARITENNMVIQTTLPIYSVQKVEVELPNGTSRDITPYVFEAAEYGRLSSYDHVYPTSKAYALYYEIGGKNIKGLDFKAASVWGDAVEHFAIYNIVRIVTGVDFTEYPLLAFRVTYTPMFSVRTTQHKQYADPTAFKRTLAYNQAANLVETRYYGENMKGAIARMGNPEIIRTYRLRENGFNMIPNIGQLWKYKGEDYYVATVTVAVYAQSVEFQVGFSKDFNRLSEYVGINSQWRAYEVSERTAYDRDYIYTDYAIIGGTSSDGKQLVTNYWVKLWSQAIVSLSINEYVMTLAEVTTVDNLNNEKTVTVPVVSSAFGNTLVYTFYMKDNYSAGEKSEYPNSPDEGISGYWQTDVPYSDYYGRFDYMRFRLAMQGHVTSGESTWLALPDVGNVIRGDIPVEVSASDQLVIDKNGSETLRMNYQVQFVTRDKDIIIGPALTQFMAARYTNKQYDCRLLALKNPVGKFDTVINEDNIAGYRRFGNSNDDVEYIDNGIRLNSTMSPATGVAWALVRCEVGAAYNIISTPEILIAKNEAVTNGEYINLPQIIFSHTII